MTTQRILPERGSLLWWLERAAEHAEDKGEEGVLIDRDHWLHIIAAARLPYSSIP